MTKKTRHDLSLPEPLLRMIEARANEAGISKNHCMRDLLEKGLRWEKEQAEDAIKKEEPTNALKPTELEPIKQELAKMTTHLVAIHEQQKQAMTSADMRHKAQTDANETIITMTKKTNNSIVAMYERTETIIQYIGNRLPIAINQVLYFISILFFRSTANINNNEVFSKKELSDIEEKAEELYEKKKCMLLEAGK